MSLICTGWKALAALCGCCANGAGRREESPQVCRHRLEQLDDDLAGRNSMASVARPVARTVMNRDPIEAACLVCASFRLICCASVNLPGPFTRSSGNTLNSWWQRIQERALRWQTAKATLTCSSPSAGGLYRTPLHSSHSIASCRAAPRTKIAHCFFFGESAGKCRSICYEHSTTAGSRAPSLLDRT